MAHRELPRDLFPQIRTKADIARHATTFAGLPVEDYDPAKPARPDVAWRFRSDWDSEVLIPHLEHFLATPAAPEATALVIGAWQADDTDRSSQAVVRALHQGRARLPQLAALYLGDITYEENEMSWIVQTDLSPLLRDFPGLQLLRARGGAQLKLTAPRHPGLRGLALETGGLDASVLHSLSRAEFPALEYLELWLGTSEYGGTCTLADLQPLLSGQLFPGLKHLGLRNAEQADEVAAAVADSPLAQRLESLDLSLGILTDEGGRHLLRLAGAPLRSLNLHYHYLGAEMQEQLRRLPFPVDLTRPEGMEDDVGESRFVAVGE